MVRRGLAHWFLAWVRGAVLLYFDCAPGVGYFLQTADGKMPVCVLSAVRRIACISPRAVIIENVRGILGQCVLNTLGRWPLSWGTEGAGAFMSSGP
jgi:hypothetical protein